MALNLSLRLSLAHLAYALLIFLYCSSSSSSAVDLLKGSTNPRRPMILPLYLSSSKTTSSSTSDRIIADHNRRQLRNSPPPPNARMRLYDDLLANGFNSQFYLLLLLLLLFSFLLLWFWFWFFFFLVWICDSYYTTRLWIGTPPQEFALIVDTGSTVTYVPCSNCGHCGKHQVWLPICVLLLLLLLLF